MQATASLFLSVVQALVHQKGIYPQCAFTNRYINVFRSLRALQRPGAAQRRLMPSRGRALAPAAAALVPCPGQFGSSFLSLCTSMCALCCSPRHAKARWRAARHLQVRRPCRPGGGRRHPAPRQQLPHAKHGAVGRATNYWTEQLRSFTASPRPAAC